MTLFNRPDWKSMYFDMKMKHDLAAEALEIEQILRQEETQALRARVQKLEAGLSTTKVKATANPKRVKKAQ